MVRPPTPRSLPPLPVCSFTSRTSYASIAWVEYGFSKGDPYVCLSNGPGVVLNLWYVLKLLPLINDSGRQNTVVGILLCGAVLDLLKWVRAPPLVTPALPGAPRHRRTIPTPHTHRHVAQGAISTYIERSR